MKPIVFHVQAAGEFRPVEFTFATEPEVRSVRAWRKMTPATDAGEFAALAAKRWFYYTREGATVASLDELHAAIKRNARAELAFLMVASAEWPRDTDFSRSPTVAALGVITSSWIFLRCDPACRSPISRFAGLEQA